MTHESKIALSVTPNDKYLYIFMYIIISDIHVSVYKCIYVYRFIHIDM